MAVEFVAGGGALDPHRKDPAIGGSCYMLDHSESSWFLGVDYGAKDLPEEERRARSDLIVALAEGWRESSDGTTPSVPVVSPRFAFEDEGVPIAGLPDDTIMRERKNGLIVLTHAHRDHSGAIPYLARQYPHLRIAMTASTLALARWVWRDELRIAMRNGEQTVFNAIDIRRLERRVEIVRPGTVLNAGPFEVEFTHNGHILGSVGVLVKRPVRVYFTGDTCLHNQRTVGGALLPGDPVEYVISESTYGGRIAHSRGETELRFIAACQDALTRGGKVLCPVLAIARTQELVKLLLDHGLLDRWPVFIDGSARETTECYIKQGILPDRIRRRYVTSAAHREVLRESSQPMIMLAPSGMMSGGFAVSYAIAWAPQGENLIALSSYQDPCSPGHRVLRARGQIVRFYDEQSGQSVSTAMRAGVENFPLSAHADGEDLLRMIDTCRPRHALLVHGDERAVDSLTRHDPSRIHKVYVGQRFQVA